jgi:hypothetical protein
MDLAVPSVGQQRVVAGWIAAEYLCP